MSEERLYYTDSYLVEFDAVVRDVVRKDDQWEVQLDRTAFYPTSGGQPYDTGTLDQAKVLDVFDDESGNVIHLVDQELEKNCRVRGHVDWERRFDHMQQHTGQHLLSAAFEREVGAKTMSFHLGTTFSTIDLDKDLGAAQIRTAEMAANTVLWEDREICVRFVTAAEAAKLPLRKDPVRTGDLRIIEITGYDISACGGTHVSRTGGIGLIAVPRSERFKGGTRIEFVCGSRALREYHRLNEASQAAVRLMSVLPHDLPAGIEKLQAASRAQAKAQEALQERLAVFEAGELAAKGRIIGNTTVVAEAVSGWDATGLKRLASSITSEPGRVVILVAADSPSAIVVSRSADVPLDAGEILRKLVERFGGKGGGKGAMAQGGGFTAPAADVLAFAKDLL